MVKISHWGKIRQPKKERVQFSSLKYSNAPYHHITIYPQKKKKILGTVCYRSTLLSKGNFCKAACKPTLIPSHCPQSMRIPVMLFLLFFTQANTNGVSLNLFWGIDAVQRQESDYQRYKFLLCHTSIQLTKCYH